MAKKAKSGISLQIKNIERLTFFEKDINELGIKKEDIKKGSASLDVKSKIDKKNNTLSFFVDVRFFVYKRKKKIEFLGITTLHVFEIMDLMNIITKDEKNRMTLPNNLMLLLIDSIMSCTRGILIASKTHSEYKDLFLPMLSPRLIFEDIKQI